LRAKSANEYHGTDTVSALHWPIRQRALCTFRRLAPKLQNRIRGRQVVDQEISPRLGLVKGRRLTRMLKQKPMDGCSRDVELLRQRSYRGLLLSKRFKNMYK